MGERARRAQTAVVTGRMRNLRSVEGLPTRDGRHTRAGTIYRSEAPCNLPAGEMAVLEALGIRTVIDLRTELEARTVPAELPGGAQRKVVSLHPASPDANGRDVVDRIFAGEILDYRAEQLADMYIEVVDEQPLTLGRVLGHLAEPGTYPALVHCTAGKDRTGIVIGIVLAAIGVDRPTILADYALSTPALAYLEQQWTDELVALGTCWSRVAPLFSAPEAALKLVFEHIDVRYGGLSSYLRDVAGVTTTTLHSLCGQLLQSRADERSASFSGL